MNHPFKFSTPHTKEINETYFQHMIFALKWSSKLYAAEFLLMLHAVSPEIKSVQCPLTKFLAAANEMMENRKNNCK